MASDGQKIVSSMSSPFPLNHSREMKKSCESVEPASTFPVSINGQPTDVATKEHHTIKCEPVTESLTLPPANNAISNEDVVTVNLDMVAQRRGRPQTSKVLGVYDMKVKFIPSLENPANYELDIIQGEKNLDGEVATFPLQYRERASNWKIQLKLYQNGRTEKFFYQEGMTKTYRSIPEVTSYILQGEVTHTPRSKPPRKRNGEASTSKNMKKAKEEVPEKEYSSMKEFYDECYNNLQNFLPYKEEGHTSNSITNNIGGENNQQRDALKVEEILAQSYNNLLHYFD